MRGETAEEWAWRMEVAKDAAKRERERLRAEDAAKPQRGEDSIGDVIGAGEGEA